MPDIIPSPVISMTSLEAAAYPALQLGQLVTLTDRECGQFMVVENYPPNALDILDCPASGKQLLLQCGEYLYAGHLGIRADFHVDDPLVVPVTDPSQTAEPNKAVGALMNKAIFRSSQLRKRLVLAKTDSSKGYGYGIDVPLVIPNLCSFRGQGDNTLLIQAADVPVITCINDDAKGRGKGYINIGDMVIRGRKDKGCTATLIALEGCHVPTSLERITAYYGGGTNITVKHSTVVTFYQVWSNQPEKHCLEIDTCRSFNMVGGACEHSSDHHIKITNSGDFHAPVANFTMLHTEGLIGNNISIFAIGGGSKHDRMQSVGISGWQILGKNPHPQPVHNYGITLLNQNVAIKADNIAKSGGHELCDPYTFSDHFALPQNYITNMAGLFLGQQDSVFNGVVGGRNSFANKGCWSGTREASPNHSPRIKVYLGDTRLPDANYRPQVTVEGFLGANRSWFIDGVKPHEFYINVVDQTTGELAHPANSVTFHWSLLVNQAQEAPSCPATDMTPVNEAMAHTQKGTFYGLAETSDAHLVTLGYHRAYAEVGETNTYYDMSVTRFSQDYSQLKRLTIINADATNGLALTAAGNDRLFAAACTPPHQTPILLLDNALDVVHSKVLDGVALVTKACYSAGIIYLTGQVDDRAVVISLSPELEILNSVELPDFEVNQCSLCPLTEGSILVGGKQQSSGKAIVAELQPDLSCSRAVTFTGPAVTVMAQRDDGVIFAGGRGQWSRLSPELAIQTTVQAPNLYGHGAISGDTLVLPAYVKHDNGKYEARLIEADHDFNILDLQKVTSGSADILPISLSQCIGLSNGDAIQSGHIESRPFLIANQQVAVAMDPLQLEIPADNRYTLQRIERTSAPATLLTVPLEVTVNSYTPELRYS